MCPLDVAQGVEVGTNFVMVVVMISVVVEAGLVWCGCVEVVVVVVVELWAGVVELVVERVTPVRMETGVVVDRVTPVKMLALVVERVTPVKMLALVVERVTPVKMLAGVVERVTPVRMLAGVVVERVTPVRMLAGVVDCVTPVKILAEVVVDCVTPVRMVELSLLLSQLPMGTAKPEPARAATMMAKEACMFSVIRQRDDDKIYSKRKTTVVKRYASKYSANVLVTVGNGSEWCLCLVG